MGADCCKVVGKSRRAWGADGDALASEYRAQPLANELAARDRHLRAEQRKAARQKDESSSSWHNDPDLPLELISHSTHMEKVFAVCEAAAKADSPLLLTGENGVGKEQIARYVHNRGSRKGGQFATVNCGALPEALLESELFGHRKGAFTGATEDKIGLFESNVGGSIFLDDIGAISPSLQVKLLRVLQDGEVWAVGAQEPRPSKVRVFAASHVDLEERAQAGKFRTDLLYRLSVVTVDIPPLRARVEDILPLARSFVMRANKSGNGATIKTLTTEAAEALTNHSWPGNVQELQSAVERAIILSGGRPKIEREDLPKAVRTVASDLAKVQFDQVMSIAELEKRYVLEVLERFRGNRTKTAKALGIGANTLWRKLKSWGVPPARGDGAE
jgi:transcriptional regulator with PAS, ATPase and Fis domain